MVPVAYRSPILIDAFFARPTALHAPQRVEHSDQIECTEATCGPRRLKGFVMAAQGHGEHPAAASRCRTLGKKFTTTSLRSAIQGAVHDVGISFLSTQVFAAN